ncbi:unnamed protein product [Lactuca virosa]|uniref:Uncharacterized protein n=1 Tax=Lactuca virosa TaxID=75947 RepID=A0AAU9NM32_9ASTR|nr:unnamed protein product [Lactuca virosa]
MRHYKRKSKNYMKMHGGYDSEFSERESCLVCGLHAMLLIHPAPLFSALVCSPPPSGLYVSLLPHSRLADFSFLLKGPQQKRIHGHRFVSMYPTGTSLLKWEALPQHKPITQKYVIPLRRGKIVKAVASPITPPLPADSAERRQELCENYGFRQIGEPLPDNITLRNIIDTLPKTALHSYGFS